MAAARGRRTVADVPSNAAAASPPVLVACDGRSPSAPRLGATLAATLGLPLTLAGAYRVEMPSLTLRPDPATASRRRRAEAERAVETAARIAGPGVVAGRHVLGDGDVADAVLSLARELGAALVVVGEDLHGHVAHDVVRRARCPVAVAPADDALVHGTLRTIAVAYDGSTGSRHALAAARRLAVASGAMLRLVAAVAGDEAWATQEERLGGELAQAVDALDGLTVSTDIVHGGPAAALRRALTSVDLAICGSHGRGRLAEAFLGSVSRDLVADPVSPVLVVPGGTERVLDAPLGVALASPA